MFDPDTAVLLRAVPDEVCDGFSAREIGLRTHVVCNLSFVISIETAPQDESLRPPSVPGG